MRYMTMIAEGCLVACFSIASAQQSSKPEERVVRIGVAPPVNQSEFAVASTRGRDRLIQDLKALRKDRKSTLVLEVIPLKSSQKDDALQEAADQHCGYVLLTKILDPSSNGGGRVGQTGIDMSPTIRGNRITQTRMAVDFMVVRAGQPSPVISDRAVVSESSDATAVPSDNSLFEEAASKIAREVADEVDRKSVV